MMLKVGGWLRGHTPVHGRSLSALDELAQIQDATSAMSHIMNDDVETAEKLLSKGTSPFHQLGVGVCTFMRATLGFEPEVMREAANALSQAENTAYEQQRRAHRNANAHHSRIFPAGTEYAVCQAEAQLMSAVVGVLNESVTESVKGFYKLRKSYITLEGIMENQKTFLKHKSASSADSSYSATSSGAASIQSTKGTSSVRSSRPATPAAIAPAVVRTSAKASLKVEQTQSSVPKPTESSKTTVTVDDEDGDEDLDFVDAQEDSKGEETLTKYLGNLNLPVGQNASTEVDSAQKLIHSESGSAPNLPHTNGEQLPFVPGEVEDLEALALVDQDEPEVDITTFSNHPIDQFILASSNFCFGMLLLLLSFIPPSFAMLLKVVGFKGDRERGMRLLWQATKFPDIHGAMAGVVLMGYLNGFTNFCDIIPSSGEGAYPKERCKALMRTMRNKYPKSHLWLIEEARMLAGERELEKAVEFIEGAGVSPLKQLEALSWFERGLSNMYMHDYKATSSSFETCVHLNNWSHGLYYYICGAACIELYRRNKVSDPAVAKIHAAEAEAFLKQVMPNCGKKKFMARQLPFDVFITRKMQKWEERAKTWDCALVDAVGVSPLEEMIYFWNGYKRMRNDHLQVSLENLAWSESLANPHWEKEDLDEKSVLVLLRAATLRNMDRTEEAKALLEKNMLGIDKGDFQGHLKDSWTAPCARYEMAASLWREADVDGQPGMKMEMLEACKNYLEEVTNWGAFDLNARIGMKVTTGKQTLRKLGVPC